MTDKLANDRISANGWPKLGGYPVVTGQPDACNTKHGTMDEWSVGRAFRHEKSLEAPRDGRLKVGTFVVEIERSTSCTSQQQQMYVLSTKGAMRRNRVGR